jgi:predicted enzyme related to lactoylglutathione lyase
MDHFSFSKLLVNDLEKTATFYKSVCGLTELARVDAEIAGRGIKEIMFNATGVGAATFVLLKFVDTNRIYTDEVITGFVTDNLEAFVARAQQAGGKLVQSIKSMPEHGVKVAFVADVEGHLLEVVQML